MSDIQNDPRAQVDATAQEWSDSILVTPPVIIDDLQRILCETQARHLINQLALPSPLWKFLSKGTKQPKRFWCLKAKYREAVSRIKRAWEILYEGDNSYDY